MVMNNIKKYTVLFSDDQEPASYCCHFTVAPGDIVVAQGLKGNEKVGLVLSVNEIENWKDYQLRQIIRIFGENELKQLVKEKEKVDILKDHLFLSESQRVKMDLKVTLAKNEIDKEIIKNSTERIRHYLELDYYKNQNALAQYYRNIILSPDGKTVIDYKGPKFRDLAIICIPPGVEKIKDDVFRDIKIDYLFIPKELQYIGKCTLFDYVYIGYGPIISSGKTIKNIHVETGSKYFYSDKNGLYSIFDGKYRLEKVFDTGSTSFVVSKKVTSIAEGAFLGCPCIKKIICSEGVEEFDDICLINKSDAEVYLSKTVRRLRTREYELLYGKKANPVIYWVDEDNEHYFRDEDSIYEVLDDGSYKLITNFYTGKGKVLILDGTSVIGRRAFYHQKNFRKITLPESVKRIEKEAFDGTFVENQYSVKV